MRQGEGELRLREGHDGGPTRCNARILAGRYRLDGMIGWGGAADVHRGFDLQLRRPVAVKIFRAGTGFDTEESFRSEAVILAQLQHPGLVTAYDAGRHDGDAYLVMQLVDGPTLKTRIAERPLSSEATAMLGADLADALDHAHEKGIIHRDVKPSNILLDASDSPHLTDFGISRLLDSTAHTATGTLIGTAAYLSPEQVLGRPVGPPADVYALGLVLLECLTGRLEYEGGPLEAAIARLHRRPALPDSLPDAFGDLLHRMTALDEHDRPTARECASALAHLADVTPAAEPVRPVAPAVNSAVSGSTAHDRARDSDGESDRTHRSLLPGAQPLAAAAAAAGLPRQASRPAFARSRVAMCGSAAALVAVMTAGFIASDGFSQHNANGEAAPSASDHSASSTSPKNPADDDGGPAVPKTSPSSRSAAARPLRATVPDSGALSSPGDHPTRHLTDPPSRTAGDGKPTDETRGKAADKKKSSAEAPGQTRKGRGQQRTHE
ncbi:protein kinase [Streptomyces sp. NPDC059690]|uniref:serine/threonine-protein kinase n=1 Tax=Streptomyces sp. NPDC059690 TaxID=3346907 RepID=UPI00368880D4